jgi:hypothetical protein
VLGCLHLDAGGRPSSGQRLCFNTVTNEDLLTAAIAAEPLLRPFLAIPSKDNGIDIEGITARGDRVLVGLRGPLLRGIAVVLDLRLGRLHDAGESNAHGLPLHLISLKLRFLDLGGLAVRDLTLLPDGDDVLILAGPTMTLPGPCLIHRWSQALAEDPHQQPVRDHMRFETPDLLLWIRDGDPGRHHDKPEGLDISRVDGDLIAWVAYDNPGHKRRHGKGCCTQLDGFLLP